MNNDVLALKYRPKFFNDVVGQDIAVETLQNSLSLSKIHNAYLFSGTRGMGKTTIARLFAKALLCKEGINKEPCGKCSTCIEIDNASHLDLIEIDAASRTKVEDTRSLMDNVQYSPSNSRFKIYLIDEVHMLSTKSFNALLKTIEEPPEHVKFLLATTEPEKLPETVLSRCLHFKLKSATIQTLVDYLSDILNKEKVKYDSKSVELIARYSEGSIRDGLSLIEQCISYCNSDITEGKISKLLGDIDTDSLEKIIEYILNRNGNKLVSYIESFSDNIDYERVFDNILYLFYKITIDKVTDTKILYKNYSKKKLHLFYQILVSSKKDLVYVKDKRSYLIMVLLRMVTFGNDDIISSQDNNLKDSIANDNKDNESTLKSPQKAITQNSSIDSTTNNMDNEIDELKWANTISKLNLNGLQAHLAENSVLLINNDKSQLIIDEEKKNIYPTSCVNDLVSVISKFFNFSLKPDILFSTNIKSPSFLAAEKIKSNKNLQYDNIKDEPGIKKIEKIFNAKIDKEQIEQIKK